MAITQQRVIRSPSCLVVGCGFRGRRIQRRHYRLDQIQDGGRRPSWKTSNGHISATRHPIDFMFGSRVGFTGSADRMALFPVGSNPRRRTGPRLEAADLLFSTGTLAVSGDRLCNERHTLPGGSWPTECWIQRSF